MNVSSYICCTSTSLKGKQIESLASILKIMAEPSRLKLLCILNQGEHCVCEIMQHVDLSQSLISHHLKDLKEAGVVQDKKRGIYVDYSLTKEGRRISSLLFQIVQKGK